MTIQEMFKWSVESPESHLPKNPVTVERLEAAVMVAHGTMPDIALAGMCTVLDAISRYGLPSDLPMPGIGGCNG